MTVFHPRPADCYSGDGGLKTYNRDGPTRQCFTSNYKPCDLTSCESEPCAGTENTIFVYELGECEYVQRNKIRSNEKDVMFILPQRKKV